MAPVRRDHVLTQTLELPLPLEAVFPFFATALNLQAITPPELHFKIVTPLPIEMRQGALIEYRLSLFGVPFRWLTEITVWEPPRRERGGGALIRCLRRVSGHQPTTDRRRPEESMRPTSYATHTNRQTGEQWVSTGERLPAPQSTEPRED